MAQMTTRKCRVLVLGSTRPRLAKVMSLLLPMNEDEAQENTESERSVAIEYLPCVATFDSYQDEKGTDIRYLISVNYHGSDGTQKVGSSLAPFFDEEPQLPLPPQESPNSTQNHDTAQTPPLLKKPRKILGILGVAIGSGIEDEEDVERIRAFFQTLRGTERDPLPMSVMQPNPRFESMKEETVFFKALSTEARESAVSEGALGPGKMAKFVYEFAKLLVQEVLQKEREELLVFQQLEMEKRQQQQEEIQTEPVIPCEIDASKPRYACRKCRIILFGDDDMEDPPHIPAQHKFSSKKMHHGGLTIGGTAAACQSYFLTDKGLDWMGAMSDMEGRLNCPKCTTKVGTWHWAGAQCSCGTWVSPAVQIPKSKVDTLTPVTCGNALPPGTVVSPFIVQLQ